MQVQQLKITIMGKANVGKSRLFNRLSASRQALVADSPGVTRDRQYAPGGQALPGLTFIDTAGWSAASDELAAAMRAQSLSALAEADLVLLVVDGSQACSAEDQECAQLIRKSGKRCLLLVNKIDRRSRDSADEYSALGLPTQHISARRGNGLEALQRQLQSMVAAAPELEASEPAPTLASLQDETIASARVVIAGRPNSGKSTLSNALLGEQRLITSSVSGTTRDSVCNSWQVRDLAAVLIDTPGLRRSSQVRDDVEKVSAHKALEALELADVVIAVIDATEGVTQQDLRVLQRVWERGCALLLAVNKCDLLSRAERQRLEQQIDYKLRFLPKLDVHWLSAQNGAGVTKLARALPAAFAAVQSKFSTNKLCKLLFAATTAQLPPGSGGKKVKLNYAHMGGDRPPTIVVHGHNANLLPASYQSYLSKYFAHHTGTDLPRLKLELRDIPDRRRKRQGR